MKKIIVAGATAAIVVSAAGCTSSNLDQVHALQSKVRSLQSRVTSQQSQLSASETDIDSLEHELDVAQDALSAEHATEAKALQRLEGMLQREQPPSSPAPAAR